MKKKLLLAILILILNLSKNAICQNLFWANQIGGYLNEKMESSCVDSWGNIYSGGSYSDSVDFDPDSGAYYLYNGGCFISKFDSSGNILWAKHFDINSLGISLACDRSGNIYILGNFAFYADFDPGIGNYTLWPTGHQDIFICKLDSAGNFIWVKQFGGYLGTGVCWAGAIAIDESGSVYTTGESMDTIDFDPGPGTWNLSTFDDLNIFISKLDSSGNFIWAKQFSSTQDNQSTSLHLDSFGNVYTTGIIGAQTDFDPGINTYFQNTVGCFLSKLDSSGNFILAKQFGSGTVVGLAISVDGNGNIYSTGRFSGTQDFDPDTGVFNITSFGGQDVFVSKLDQSGNFIWARQMGGTSTQNGTYLSVDLLGNVYLSGYFNDTVDIDPGIGIRNFYSQGGPDIFILKLDSAVTTGIVDLIRDQNLFNIFPNPAQVNFTVTTTTQIQNDFIEIFDLLGKKVVSNQLAAGKVESTIDVSNLSPGLYFVKVQTEKGSAVQKLMVQ